ncbi:MAG: helix-turn-helix transcriptional regulator, partial [Lachnospiraceae bacterium]|nr:helix-turn-helix transcriptional regulator [Lachnospiraceae bacterium]
MDQQKIGAFLKELRKEKNITQEELAEKMLVSRRT